MQSPRDYSLPHGLSGVGEYLQSQEKLKREQFDDRNRQFRLIIDRSDWKKSPDLFLLLSQRIDRDLLFTEQKELVFPKIQELVSEECDKTISTLPAHVTVETKNLLIKIVSEGVWREICRHRPRYPGDKRGIMR
jgi:hypothetical protein